MLHRKYIERRINGIFLLNKSEGLTSNAALQKVKHLFKAKKAGHTGSLDPLATGMLPICFGEATKFSQFLLDSNKTYIVEALLGITTTTGDSEGEVSTQHEVKNFSNEEIDAALSTFVGKHQQIPPMYSAIKHHGKPLYQLARKGIEVERKPRDVVIYDIKLIAYADNTIRFSVVCSKGTYVRTLAEDIGNLLGCGGHVIGLHRLNVSPYENVPMYTLDELNQLTDTERLSLLLPIETAVNILPSVKLSASAVFYLRTGQSVRTTLPLDSKLVRLFAEDASFLGIGEVLTDGRVKPHRLVSS